MKCVGSKDLCFTQLLVKRVPGILLKYLYVIYRNKLKSNIVIVW